MDIDSKAKAMCKKAGNKLSPDDFEIFNQMSIKKLYQGLVFKYDGKNVSLDFSIAKGSGLEALVNGLKGDSPRFIVWDHTDKLLFVYFKPEGCKATESMKYNSVKGGLLQELGNLKEKEIPNINELEEYLK